MHASKTTTAALALMFCAASPKGASSPRPGTADQRARSVAQCSNVFLHASYLAEEQPGHGPAFLLEVHNDRDVPIAIADPAPLSIHWYAHVGSAWLWRASGGSGGALVNALQEHGPVFTEAAPTGAGARTTQISPHQVHTWTALLESTPALAYRPGCQHCALDKQREYRAILAYAVRPAAADAGSGWLQCGLRSNPVIMPPLEDFRTDHNFGAGPASIPK